MAKVYLEDSTLTGIGNAIREKNGTTDLLLPSEMITAIQSISGGDMELADYMRLSDLIIRFSISPTRVYTEKDYTEAEVQKTQNLLNKLGEI